MKKHVLSFLMAAATLLQVAVAQTFTFDSYTYKVVREGYVMLTGVNESLHGTATIASDAFYKNDSWTVIGIDDRAFYNNTKITAVELPSTITSIGKEAFAGCSNLQSVTFQANSQLATLGEYTFRNCSSLPSINLPSGLEEIPASAFSGCTRLRSINMPDSLKFIRKSAFLSCLNLSMISLPYTLESIDEAAFNGCQALNEIFLWSAEYPQADNSAFLNIGANPTLYSFIQATQPEAWDFAKKATLSISRPVFEYTGQVPTMEIQGNTSSTYHLSLDTKGWNPNAGTYQVHKVNIVISNNTGFHDTMECSMPSFSYTITPKVLTAYVGNFTREYGDPNPSPEEVLESLTYSGFVNNENDPGFTKFPSAVVTDAISTTSVSSLSISLTEDGKTQNYLLFYIPGTLTITKAPLTIQAKPYTIKYGDELPEFDCRYIGFKNNENQSVLQPQAEVEYTGGDRPIPGKYVLTPGNADAQNYSISYVNDTLTVEKAPLTITAQSYTITYGEPAPDPMEILYDGFVYDEDQSVLITPAKLAYNGGVNPVADEHTIEVSGATAANYEITHENGILTVNQALLTATAQADTIVYGESLPDFQYKLDGFVYNEDESVLTKLPVASSNASAKADAGTYQVSVEGGEADNYRFQYIPADFIVLKKAITGKVGTLNRIYGAANPTAKDVLSTVVYSGLANDDQNPGEIAEATVVTTATTESATGIYDISLTETESQNYELEYLAGTLTIEKAPLQVIAQDVNVIYGNPFDLTYKFEGFVNGDDESCLSEKPSIQSTAGERPGAGQYPISVSGGSAQNYEFSHTGASLNVSKATLLATAKSYTIQYGEPVPDLQILYSGFAYGEDSSALKVQPTVSCPAGQTPLAGSYPITVSGGEADNYEFSYAAGSLTVNQAQQSIVWDQTFPILTEGERIALTAQATSGLPVSYTSSDPQAADIIQEAGVFYLECRTDIGRVTLTASQEGDENYLAATPISKEVEITHIDTIPILPPDTTDIEPNMFANVHCYPNPAQNEIHINGVPASAEIVILDANGRTMQRLQSQGANTTVLLESYKSGLYFIRLREGDKTHVIRFIKK